MYAGLPSRVVVDFCSVRAALNLRLHMAVPVHVMSVCDDLATDVPAPGAACRAADSQAGVNVPSHRVHLMVSGALLAGGPALSNLQ
jgi:hypothetical protein